MFDEPCAQHLLAFLLAFARQLPEAIREQLGGRDWSVERRRMDSRLLQDGKLLVVGYGAIARRLVELLGPFGMEIVAVRRAPKGDEAVPTHPIDALDRLLPEADYVANVLPANASTDGLFDADRFSKMKDGALFLNIGRGTTVDQDALLAALPRLAGAYLDVTDPEPLPKDHPLWTAPKVTITPHTAGGHRGEELRLVRHFLANLDRFRRGEDLVGSGHVDSPSPSGSSWRGAARWGESRTVLTIGYAAGQRVAGRSKTPRTRRPSDGRRFTPGWLPSASPRYRRNAARLPASIDLGVPPGSGKGRWRSLRQQSAVEALVSQVGDSRGISGETAD